LKLHRGGRAAIQPWVGGKRREEITGAAEHEAFLNIRCCCWSAASDRLLVPPSARRIEEKWAPFTDKALLRA